MANIFVGNIGALCTEPLMRSIFEVYGQVDNVTVACHGAIIQMSSDSEADEAVRALSDSALFLTPLVSRGARELMWSRFHSE